MKSILYLILFFGSTSFAESELSGICEQEKTAASCTFINNTAHNIDQVVWLLEGSWVDYGDDVRVNIAPGNSTVVTNKGDQDNCLFTEWTTVYAYNFEEKLVFDNPESVIMTFDDEGNCTVEFN